MREKDFSVLHKRLCHIHSLSAEGGGGAKGRAYVFLYI